MHDGPEGHTTKRAPPSLPTSFCGTEGCIWMSNVGRGFDAAQVGTRRSSAGCGGVAHPQMCEALWCTCLTFEASPTRQAGAHPALRTPPQLVFGTSGAGIMAGHAVHAAALPPLYNNRMFCVLCVLNGALRHGRFNLAQKRLST